MSLPNRSCAVGYATAMHTPDADWIQELRERMLGFFDQHARPMPWRETTDPYAIWVSEVMLQQTRVDTVIPYYRAWMERFPTVDALAAADEGEVLKRWEGLGYYSRARNLHRAAMVVRERHGGAVPADRRALGALPGIGPYTSGAIASIAFGARAPAVDGNVRRVVARLLDWPDPRGRALEDVVAVWVPPAEPGAFNQALMELGATVCTPRAPRCDTCPVASLCEARAAGVVEERPAPRPRAIVPGVVEGVAVVYRRRPGAEPGTRGEAGVSEGGDRSEVELALRQRPAEGLLARMWEFPGDPVEEGRSAERVAAAIARPDRGGARDDFGGPEGSALPEVPHTFSHLRVTYRPFLFPGGDSPPRGCAWCTAEEIQGLPLPAAQQSIVRSAFAALAEEAGR